MVDYLESIIEIESKPRILNRFTSTPHSPNVFTLRCIGGISGLAIQTLAQHLTPQSQVLTALVTSLLAEFDSLTADRLSYLCACLQRVNSADAADFLQLIAARVLTLSSGNYSALHANNTSTKMTHEPR